MTVKKLVTLIPVLVSTLFLVAVAHGDELVIDMPVPSLAEILPAENEKENNKVESVTPSLDETVTPSFPLPFEIQFLMEGGPEGGPGGGDGCFDTGCECTNDLECHVCQAHPGFPCYCNANSGTCWICITNF